MRRPLRLALLLLLALFPLAPRTVLAASPVAIVSGPSWDGPEGELQHIVDGYLGVPGALNVNTDFVGAHAGDIDPWFWVGSGGPVLLVTAIAANKDFNALGWYVETGTAPVIDGIDDGEIFSGTGTTGASAILAFPGSRTKFGFYLDTHQLVTTPTGTREQIFCTNRKFNDVGPSGFAPTHAPFDGDVQAKVFDVSAWKGTDTWLICFEDRDSGLPMTPCCAGTDNDFNDLVFQIKAMGATPAQKLTFGGLKARYH